MGDKIHYYCLNELLWHSALSAGNLWPQAACPPGASFIDPPEPDRGLRPILLLKLHSIHTHFGHFYTRGWTRSYQPALQLRNMHETQHNPASHLHRTAPNRGQSPGGHPAVIHAASVERPARSSVSVVEYRHRFTNPPSFILWRQTPYAPVLGRSAVCKIIGHLAVHQNITV